MTDDTQIIAVQFQGIFCRSRSPPEPVLTDRIQIWRPAQRRDTPLLKHLIRQGREIVRDTHLRFHWDRCVTQIKVLEGMIILKRAGPDNRHTTLALDV